MNEEEKKEIELDIEAKYVDKTEKEFLSRVTYAECLYILTPENKYCNKIIELSLLKLCEIIGKLQKENEELKILKDDIQDKRIAYIDTPQFKENFISKQEVKNKIEELEQKREEYYNENKLIIDNIINKKEFYGKFNSQDIHTYATFNEFNAEISLSKKLIEEREEK